MAARLDAPRREIEAGGQRIPFRLDLRDDVATLTLDGRDYAVRPLRWREKVTLARFAEAPEILGEEFLRLCVTPEPPRSDVLFELARWMNAAPSAAAVPFDMQSVAGVTLQLCRALHLPPSDFEPMRAVDVEAMWQALGGEANRSTGSDLESAAPARAEAWAAESASATKIVIVPDPAPGAAAAATEREDETTIAASAASTAASPSPESTSDAPRETERRHGGPNPETPPSIMAELPRAKSANGRALRFRVLNTPPPHDGALLNAIPRPQQPREEPRQAEMPQSVQPPAHPFLSPVETEPARAAAADAPPSAPPSDPEVLFDELADRLERAAADMGIGEV